MRFRRPGLREGDLPEINFIPLIDLLLVVLIFVLVTTTYARHGELQVELPFAASDPKAERPEEILVVVGREGRYVVDREPVAWRGPDAFADALRRAAAGRRDPIVLVQADARAAHQNVMNVLDAAQRAGLARVGFATQTAPQP